MKKFFYILIALYFSIAMYGCTHRQEAAEVPHAPINAAPDLKPAEEQALSPVTEEQLLPAPELAWGYSPTRDVWAKSLRESIRTLGTDMLKVVPSDIKEFCPNFKNLADYEKVEFYAQLISVMSKYESNYKPETTYTEGFNDAKGNPVISRGLLQISIESGKSYDCPLKTAQDLHKPEVNLACGVRILNRWVSRDGRIAGYVEKKWRGGARYWSVLRKKQGVKKTSYDGIKGYMLARNYCM